MRPSKGPEREAFLDQACAGVIDFGIAKATQQELTEKTVYTQFQQFIGTPAYMSPEQAEMSGLGHQQSNSVFGVAISPDGRLLATVALGGEVNIWDVDSHRLIETPEKDDSWSSVAFSPDGKVLAFGTGKHGVRLWDVERHQETTRFPVEASGGYWIRPNFFSSSR